MNYTPTDCKNIVEEIEERDPVLIRETYNKIKKIEAHYRYFFTITDVLVKYCERRKLQYINNNDHILRGRNISQGLKQERSIFIAVALWLFSPSVYKMGKRSVRVRNEIKKETIPIYNAEDGIRHHLSGILGCNEGVVSKLVNPIASAYNERNRDFKNMVDSLVEYIKDEVRESVIEEEPVEEQQQMQLLQ